MNAVAVSNTGTIILGAILLQLSLKKNILIQSNTTQVYFNSNGYLYMYVQCFILY